ncbi:hypothetical protein [Hoeflea prorocentri]|uniref:Exostosin GT47 domain-containing protein n=1 Tax=Hoeflea prorocentri TaxID=1922333 RepID=A0A9X3UHL6_9HYPH|nr:hypothetical protein [Hoeflea prorocentri]MCY6380814.1 hypothetical protein [Hoeflea prorocentri]MDA5398614.1 hypothetical protein [Hoeflea prorocentri]
MGLKRRVRRISNHLGAYGSLLSYRLHASGKTEAACRYVGSHGIKKTCDFWTVDGSPHQAIPANGQGSRSDTPPPVIYVKTEFLHKFSENSLESLDMPFVLVTGCCDVEAGPRDLEQELRSRLLDNPNLVSWYAQNCNDNHPKLRPLPIGLDYHTLTFQMRFDPWGYFDTPVEQEKTLDTIRIAAPRLKEKKLAGYCNWHHALDRGDRLRCINAVDFDTLALERLSVERSTSWKNNATHFFTLSPLGAGLDCHRTWEALLLGSVPIVPRSGISSLFDDLPVCVVDDWSEVTVNFMQQQRERILGSQFDFSSLYLETWLDRFRGRARRNAKRQSFQDFVDMAHQGP